MIDTSGNSKARRMTRLMKVAKTWAGLEIACAQVPQKEKWVAFYKWIPGTLLVNSTQKQKFMIKLKEMAKS